MRFVAAVSLAVFVVVVAMTAAQAPAQQPIPKQPPRITSGIDLIQLDVTVLDRNRRPVHELKASDFTVLEDGKPQDIVAFDAIDVPEPDTVAASWTREVAPDVASNAVPANGRLVVIVMDDATIPPDPAMVKSAKEIGRTIVDQLGPSDQAAVVFTLDNRHAQDFTFDRARLRTAVESFSSRFGFGGDDRLFWRYSIRTIERASEYLRAIPQRRKALMYISVGVPGDFAEAATPIANLGAPGVVIGPHEDMRALLDDLRDAFGEAMLANVSIYAFDPGGLDGVANYLSTRGPGGGMQRMDIVAAQASARLRTDYLHVVADNTGGFVAVDTNAPGASVAAAFQENGSYYLVGYRSPRDRTDGKYHRVEVKVNKPGVTVRSRTGYYNPRAPKREKANGSARAQSPLIAALAGFLPATEVPMQAVAMPFAAAVGRPPTLAIVARLRHPPVEARGRQQVELLTSAFDGEGNSKASRRQTVTLVLRPTGTDAEYEVLSTIDLKPGHYSLRIAANNQAIEKTGSVYCDVDVPDFGKLPLSLSGVAVSMKPNVIAAPKDGLAAVLPVVPTAAREFPRDVEAAIFTRIYQPGGAAPRAVRVHIAIKDAGDRTVAESDDSFGADAFSAGRTADYRYTLPLAQLTPGQHLLTLEATAAGVKPVRRAVRFVMQ
jgi:VWFA-related protein